LAYIRPSMKTDIQPWNWILQLWYIYLKYFMCIGSLE